MYTCVANPCKQAPSTEIPEGKEAFVPVPGTSLSEARHLACRLQPGSWSKVVDLATATVDELGDLREDDYVLAEGRYHRLTRVKVDEVAGVVVQVDAFSVTTQTMLHLVTMGHKVLTPSDPLLGA